jgi:hypothetical protein
VYDFVQLASLAGCRNSSVGQGFEGLISETSSARFLQRQSNPGGMRILDLSPLRNSWVPGSFAGMSPREVGKDPGERLTMACHS